MSYLLTKVVEYFISITKSVYMSDETIHDLPHADFYRVSVNEIALDQKQSDTEPGQPSHDDPVAFRFGAWANPKDRERPLGRLKWYIAKISLDVLRWIQGRKSRTEIGFLKLAVDELFDMDGKPVPMVALFLTENTEDSFDDAMAPVAIFTRSGIRFLVPVYGMNQSVAPKVTRFYADNGKYCFNVQGDTDGQIIRYDTHGSADETTWTATGKVVIDPKL